MFYIIQHYSKDHSYNPRSAVNGIDTIYTEDSMYKVRLSIDTVEAMEKYYEPKEDPRR